MVSTCDHFDTKLDRVKISKDVSLLHYPKLDLQSTRSMTTPESKAPHVSLHDLDVSHPPSSIFSSFTLAYLSHVHLMNISNLSYIVTLIMPYDSGGTIVPAWPPLPFLSVKFWVFIFPTFLICIYLSDIIEFKKYLTVGVILDHFRIHIIKNLQSN